MILFEDGEERIDIVGNDTEQDPQRQLDEVETNDIEYEMEYDLDSRI